MTRIVRSINALQKHRLQSPRPREINIKLLGNSSAVPASRFGMSSAWSVVAVKQ